MLLEWNSRLSETLITYGNNQDFFHYIADFPIFFLPVFLLGVWLYYTFKVKDISHKRIELLHIFYACVLGMIFSYIIKQFVDIDRPENYIESTKSLLLGKIPEKSFPSDHATISFAFTTALLFTSFRKIGYIFLPFVIAMNISRIIVGVHWPLDIIAGSMLGMFSGYIFFTFAVKKELVKSLNMIIIKVMKVLHLY